MAKTSAPKRGKNKDNARRSKKKISVLNQEKIDYVDYKDIGTLQKLLTNRGKIYSRKRSGNCAGCQRKAKRAIKRARYMALLPFTA